jgi:hypothetical protein
MQIDARQYREIIKRMSHEGDPQLLIGPVSDLLPDIPASWNDALRAVDPINAISQLWAPVRHRLPRVAHALNERLLGVGLLRTDEVPAGLLYFFGSQGELFVYRGRPPAREYQIGVSPIPAEFLEFYRIHNGWVLDYDEDEGPLPIERWTVPELIWGDARWKPFPGVSSTNDTIVVFRGGADLGFAYELSSHPPMPILLSAPATAHALFDMWVAIDDHVSRFLLGFERIRVVERSAAELARHYSAQLKAVATQASEVKKLAGPAAHRHWFRLLLERASVDAEAARAEVLNSFHREALQQGCIAIERSAFIEVGELLALFGLAHAIGDVGAARFVASVPPRLWLTGSPESLQVNALFDLFFGRWDRAALSIEQVIASLPQNLPSDDTVSLVPRLIAALVQRNRTDFDRYRAGILQQSVRWPERDGINLSSSIRLAAFEGVARQIGLLGRV